MSGLMPPDAPPYPPLPLFSVTICHNPASDRYRVTRMRNKLALPALLTILLMQAALAEPDLLARGGEIEFRFNTGILEPYGIEVRAGNALDIQPPTEPQGYLHIRFAGTGQQSLAMQAPNLALREFSAGGLSFSGQLEFQRGSQSLRLEDFTLATAATSPPSFNLEDQHGQVWLRMDHVHFELMDGADWLSLRYMDIWVTTAMAEVLGVPDLAGERIGGVFASSPIVERAEGLEPLGSCQVENANWPTEPEFDANIAMTGMGTPSYRRCQGCNGSSGGPLVIAPDATLTNVGSADVPWWLQFTGPYPPYDNDQHPYLIWNLYRLSAEGQLEMIAVSGLKHTFYTINIGADCPCGGGNILWSGCVDIYAATSNDDGRYLAPRNEIIPAQGLWGRCHSFFDPDCDGQQNPADVSGNYENRLKVMESELDPSANPGARYFLDAWYVTRDEVNIFNAMGWLEITPTWNGFTWSFPVVSGTGMNQGSILDVWQGAGDDAMRSLVSTEHGTVIVSVRTTDLEDGYWRYDYAVFNYDFMLASTGGAEPNLEVLSNRGLIGLQVPARSQVDIGATDFARADRLNGQDWTITRQTDEVLWTDPGDTPLDWGMMYRFTLVADHPPVRSEMKLTFGEGAGEFVGASTLAPSPSIFADRFEP